MSLLRRITATFSGVLVLQLTLLASGTLCTMQRDAMLAEAVSAHVMEDMMQPGSPMGSPSCDALAQTNDCRLPWAPGSCASMTTCTLVATPTAPLVAQATDVHVVSQLPEPATIHSGPAIAPELPPPRA